MRRNKAFRALPCKPAEPCTTKHLFPPRSPRQASFPLIAPVLLLAALTCRAEDKDASVAAYFQEFPVVLTASRLSQPLSEAPSAMTVIDGAMIRASGFRTVPELMQLVPGMYVGYADANRPVVSLHGATDDFSRRMQILIDGRSVYLPPFGGVNWADLPLQIEDIERIEVVRGPSTASHGTNSFYGVINILTREAVRQAGASVSAAVGDASDYSARYGKAGENLDYRFSVGYRADRGIDHAILNDHNKTRLFNFRSNYRPTLTDSLDVQVGATDGVYGIGIAGRPEDAFRDTTAKSAYLQASWLHVWPSNTETRLTYAYTDHNSVDPYRCFDTTTCEGKNLPAIPVVQGFTRLEVYSRRNELELQNTHQPTDDNRLVWGIRSRQDYADYPLYLGRPYTVNSWQVFAHNEWRVTDAAIVNAGAMYEDNGMGSKNLSPRLSLNYHLTPQHTLRLGVSTATRSPAMGEVYMDANNTLLGGAYASPVSPITPEKILSREIGYLGEFPSLGMSVDGRLYSDHVDDMIYVDHAARYPSSVADSFKNMFSAEFRGVEATVKWRWDEGHSFLSANFARQQASIGIGNYPTQYFSPLPDPTSTFSTAGELIQYIYQTELFDLFSQIVPTNSFSLLLSQRLNDDWQFSAGFYWRDPVRVMTVGPDVTRENTMQRLDLRIARTFKLEQGRSAELALVVQNATQNRYTKFGVVDAMAEVYYARRGWLTANINF